MSTPVLVPTGPDTAISAVLQAEQAITATGPVTGLSVTLPNVATYIVRGRLYMSAATLPSSAPIINFTATSAPSTFFGHYVQMTGPDPNGVVTWGNTMFSQNYTDVLTSLNFTGYSWVDMLTVFTNTAAGNMLSPNVGTAGFSVEPFSYLTAQQI